MTDFLRRLGSWSNFTDFMGRQIRVYVFFLVVLCVFRLIFVGLFHEYLSPAVTLADITLAFWIGLKLSCKSAGWLTLLSLTAAFTAHIFKPQWERTVQRLTNAMSLLTLSILFMARFPYYRQFHSSFNQLLFNTFNDDIYALLLSLVKEFYLPLRLAGATVLAFFLYRLLNRWLDAQTIRISTYFSWNKWFGRAFFLLAIYLGILLSTFGGSLGWQTAVDWENAGVTKDSFLNEAILDDLQAVYRGYTMNNRLEACNGLSFTPEQIQALAAKLAGQPPVSSNLDDYLEKKAQGPAVKKPQQIFLIIGESYANWPLLDKYKELHIADGMKAVIAESDSAYCKTFLPNGASTVSAVTGIVTGFADANLYLTTMPEAFAAAYPTASAPQLAKLGYQTNFWYAGPATWERIGAFVKAQGYDNFYGRGDFAADAPGSVWGCDDEYLYQMVMAGVPADQPSFNVVLNVSNHSPFSVDTEKAGFDKEKVRAALPPEARDDEALLKQLGHFWYEDKMMAEFITAAKKKYPDSLFIIIGDHADRYNVEKIPSSYERYGIPLIITGSSVQKSLLPPEAAGSQIDVVPTLIEMIAPADFHYYSLGKSLTRDNHQGVNYGFWITAGFIGKADAEDLAPEAIGINSTGFDRQALRDYIDGIRSISWWRAKYGPELDPALLERDS